MKIMKSLISLFLVLVLSLSVVGITSANFNAPATIQIGDDRERASNPFADDLEDQILTITTSLILANTGNETISGITSQILPSGGFTVTDTNIQITNMPTSLNPGQNVNVIISGVIPKDLDAVDSRTLRELAFEVATITFTGSLPNSTIVSQTVKVNMQRENQLTIDDIDVCVNTQCVSVDDGDDVENIRPGDRIEFTFIIENGYRDSGAEDLDIEDVDLEWEIDDDDLNEDDDESMGDISADDKEEESFAFTIDDDVSAGSYTVTARVVGRDENNALHGQEIEFDLEVERDRHDITIRRVSVSPSTLSCSGSNIIAFNVGYVNIGRSDEDDVILSVENDELSIIEQIGPINLDEDNSRQDTIRVTIPQDASPDSYIFKVKSFFDNTIQSDEEHVSLIVPECDVDPVVPPVVVVTPPPVVVQPPTPPIVPQRSVQDDDDTISPVYLVGLAMGVLILLTLIGGFGAMALRRRRD